MEQMIFTEKGVGRRTIPHEEEIACLKERITALEQANGIMHEALHAARLQSEALENAENGLRGLALHKHHEVIKGALRVSSAIQAVLTALDSQKEAMKWD